MINFEKKQIDLKLSYLFQQYLTLTKPVVKLFNLLRISLTLGF